MSVEARRAAAEGRQRNRVAVRRYFERPATASSYSNSNHINNTSGDTYARAGAGRPASAPSSASASAAHRAVTVAELVGRDGRAPPPAVWVGICSSGGGGGAGGGDMVARAGRRLEVAAAMGEDVRCGGGDGVSAAEAAAAALTREERTRLLLGDPRVSSLALRYAVSRHEADPQRRRRGSPDGGCADDSATAARRYHHQQAVLRHERTLPRRRAVDHYVQLTAAQADTGLRAPNAHTAAVLARRRGGRWVLDNEYRQQLDEGPLGRAAGARISGGGCVPAMTRVMRGDFYEEGAAARRAARMQKRSFVDANKRDVRVASQVNRELRLQQQQQLQGAPGECRCRSHSPAAAAAGGVGAEAL